MGDAGDDDDDGWGDFEGGMGAGGAPQPPVDAGRPPLGVLGAGIDVDRVAPLDPIAGGAGGDSLDDSFGDFLGSPLAPSPSTVDDSLIARLAGVAVGGEGLAGASLAATPRAPAPHAAVAAAELLPRGAALPEDLFAEPVAQGADADDGGGGTSGTSGAVAGDDDDAPPSLEVEGAGDDAGSPASLPPDADVGGGWDAFAGAAGPPDAARPCSPDAPEPCPVPEPESRPPDDDGEGSDWDEFEGAQPDEAAVEAAVAVAPPPPPPSPPPHPPPPSTSYPSLWTTLLDAAAAELEIGSDCWRRLSAAAGGAHPGAHPRVARYLVELAHVRAAALEVKTAIDGRRVDAGAGVARAVDRARLAWDADEALTGAIADAAAAWGGEAVAWRLLSRPTSGGAGAPAASRCRLTLLPTVDDGNDLEPVGDDGVALGAVARLWRARVVVAA